MYRVTLFKNENDKIGTVVQASYVDQILVDGQLGIGINVSDKFTFKLYPFDEIYNQVQGMVSSFKIEFESDGRELSRGRVLFVEEMYDDSGFYKSITCSGELDYLNDSKQPFQKTQNTTPAQDFRNLIGIHNQQVSASHQFKVGKIEITNSTDNVYHYVEQGAATLTVITEKLINKWGGELHVRHESDGVYIDWLKEIGIHAKQQIDVNSNLQTMERKLDPSLVYTVFYPYGATIEQTDSSESTAGTDVASPRLTIGTVNGGRDYIERADLISQYGRISGTNNWDDVHDANILKSKAITWFNSYKPVAVGYQITAINLKPLNLAVDSFAVGNYHQLLNEYMGIDDELRIVTMTLNLDNPESDTMTIGDKELTLAEYNSAQKKATAQISVLRSNLIGQNLIITETNKKLASMTNGYNQLVEETGRYQTETDSTIQAMLKRLAELEGQDNPIGKIIDISEWQGAIDFNALRNDDISLMIIRVQSGSNYQDKTYLANIRGAQAAGIKYAVYAYAAYSSDADAQTEADDFYSRTQTAIGSGSQPVFYMIDVEEQSAANMRTATEAWCNRMATLGVLASQQVAYIANHLYDAFNINVDKFGSIVIPSYGANDGTIANSSKPTHPYDLWQYTSTGSVSGIIGNVDMNTEPSARFKEYYLKG